MFSKACRPRYLFPAYYVASEVYKDIHLREQRTISKLNSLQLIVIRQDLTYLYTIDTDIMT